MERIGLIEGEEERDLPPSHRATRPASCYANRTSMDLLPPVGTRAPLLDALAHIIARSGFETFVGAPLLFPDSTYFPEPWEPTERGVRLLALRLLAYAGLDELDAHVVLYSNRQEDVDLPIGQHAIDGAAAWFAGIEEDACLFGAETKQLEDGDAIVGTMCHEIAHAYRAHHELEATRRDIDEDHTDITTVYLGFGLLTLNNSYRFRTKAAPTGMVAGSSWSVSHTGYLSTQAMAYLLAAHVLVRGLDEKERRRIAGALDTNQRACFEAACDELGRDVDALCAQLGIPPKETWPEPTPFVLPELPEDAYFVPEAAPTRRAFNEGNVVFRVRTTRTALYATIGSVVGMIALAVARRSLSLPNPGGPILGAALGVAVGGLIGAYRSRYTCSEPRCEARQASGTLERCPRCGGTIRATLRWAGDRLGAQEAIDEGRPIADIEREFAESEARSKRRALVVFAGFITIVGWLAFAMLVPKRTTIAGLRGDADLVDSYVRIEGNVVQPLGGGELVNQETHEVFQPFVLDDGSDAARIWCNPTTDGRLVKKGLRVSVTGRYTKVPGGFEYIAEGLELR